MENRHRITGEKIDLDTANVKSFFDGRCGKKLPYLYNYVNYQDKHPELVLERDKHEKETVFPSLGLKRGSRILDIGCGVGRWATDELLDAIGGEGLYVGVDYTEGFLKMAREKTAGRDNCMFFCGSFQEVLSVLPEKMQKDKFDVVLVSGVMVYINDDDIQTCLKNVNTLLADDGVAYMRESVGFTERLTLKENYSDEMESEYSAIYRSIAEYDEIFASLMPWPEFTVIDRGDLWKWNLQNRKETTSYYWLFKRKQP